MLATGRKPHCITFYVEGIESNDLRSARNVCKTFGLALTEVMLPHDVERTVADIRKVLPHCHLIKKTIIQCMQPWLYIYPAMRSDLILDGLGGDDLYCNQRKVQVALHQKGEAAILKWRKVYSDDLDFSSGNIHRFAAYYQKRSFDFYHSPAIEQWFLQFKVKALHSPYEKYPSVAAFVDFYQHGNFRRSHSSYQINSGLREVHDQLLRSPYNQRKAQSVVAIYNDLAKEIL
jgi:hypothetical protein